jgi:hypothetical protein
MKNKFESQNDEALVMNWGLLVDQHNYLYEMLEQGYLSPETRERMEIGLDRTSEIIDLAEAVMSSRNMFNEAGMLKPEFSLFLAQGKNDTQKHEKLSGKA